MNKKRFVLCDSDRQYMERFLNVVQEKLEAEFSVYVYADVRQLKELLSGKTVEILLISRALYEHLERQERSKIRHVFRLCEEAFGTTAREG